MNMAGPSNKKQKVNGKGQGCPSKGTCMMINAQSFISVVFFNQSPLIMKFPGNFIQSVEHFFNYVKINFEVMVRSLGVHV